MQVFCRIRAVTTQDNPEDHEQKVRFTAITSIYLFEILRMPTPSQPRWCSPLWCCTPLRKSSLNYRRSRRMVRMIRTRFSINPDADSGCISLRFNITADYHRTNYTSLRDSTLRSFKVDGTSCISSPQGCGTKSSEVGSCIKGWTPAGKISYSQGSSREFNVTGCFGAENTQEEVKLICVHHKVRPLAGICCIVYSLLFRPAVLYGLSTVISTTSYLLSEGGHSLL